LLAVLCKKYQLREEFLDEYIFSGKIAANLGSESAEIARRTVIRVEQEGAEKV